jgi:hypothetical protein
VSGRYSDNFSDPNWWPTPPPKPLRAPSAAKILLVVLLAAAGGGGIYAATRLSPSHSPSHTATVPAAPAPDVRVGAAAQDDREAMRQCLRSLGAGSGSAFGSRFGGGGPARGEREAFAVCRSLLQPDRARTATQPTATIAPPAA